MRSFRVLGPVEAWAGDRRLVLGGSRQLKLFAFLLLHANRAVSTDALIDAVWGPERDGAVKRLQMAIARLRRALEPLDAEDGGVLRTVSGGYVLSVAPGELDTDVFGDEVVEGRRALANGDPARASRLLGEAMALWRGPALAEVSFEDFAQAEIRRLDELRMSALESRIDADLERGQYDELIGELEALIAEHPTRERFAGQLMTALYRAGRQADALDVYQRVRIQLAEQLGLQPGPSLGALQTKILEQAPELSTNGSPLVSSEPAHNLPAPTSSFVGRDRELDGLRELLARSRVVTLIGAGGVGKTRLALQVAAQLLPGSGDGAWFVDLAPLIDPGLVASTVASVLGVPEEPGRPVQESLVAALRAQRLLIVLDNCEHVIDETARLVEELAQRCPKLVILSTSREPLRVSGEHVYRVPSLLVPPSDEDDPDVLIEFEAVQLFLERASDQQSGVVLDADSAAVIGRLCRRLDGIPLAIELGVARLRSMSLADLDRRLDQRLRLLTGGNRTALPRQRTLEALIDWSYDLLSPAEQELLDRLSVFAGGFNLDAAEAVTCWGRGLSIDVLDGVTGLVDKSLVETDRSATFRYRLLESVRQYAAAKLLARGEGVVRAACKAHRDYYLDLAETAAPHLIGHGQVEWLDRLELELDNLRAGLAHSAQDPDPDPGLRMSGALRYFWNYREPRTEGATAVCDALDRADARRPTLRRGGALVAAATLLPGIAGEYDEAGKRAREAIAIAEELRDEDLRADALVALALAEGERGNTGDHFALTSDALRAARAVANPHLTAEILMSFGSSPRLMQAEYAQAFEEALVLCRQTGNQILYVRTLCNFGFVEVSRGHLDTGRAHLEEGVRLAREMGDLRALTFYACNLGFAAYVAGADADAREMFEESLRVARRTGNGLIPAYAQLGFALLATRAGDPELAAKLHGVADRMHQDLGTRVYGIESALRDADITRLREVLGDVEFEAAYRAGRVPHEPAAPVL